MGKWNDTDEPFAFLITFRTYGTWLAGDERGSVDKYHNKYSGPRSVSSEARREKGEWPFEHSPWVDKGSRRNLWTEDHIARAADYVINGQGDDLPEFD